MARLPTRNRACSAEPGIVLDFRGERRTAADSMLTDRERMMTDSVMYHEGNRRLQDQFESRPIADRLESFARKQFTSDDRAFIENAPYFFLPTADPGGRPDCSFKGGMPGFVSVTGPSELAFPDYDGNGMFKSLGNILVNAEAGLLFIAMHGKPQRLRVNGAATVSRDDPLLARTGGAQ